MTSAQLAEYQSAFTEYARKRLLGVGREQYDRGSQQKFETMTVEALALGLREELADIVNYATMIDIVVERWMHQLHALRGEA